MVPGSPVSGCGAVRVEGVRWRCMADSLRQNAKLVKKIFQLFYDVELGANYLCMSRIVF